VLGPASGRRGGSDQRGPRSTRIPIRDAQARRRDAEHGPTPTSTPSAPTSLTAVSGKSITAGRRLSDGGPRTPALDQALPGILHRPRRSAGSFSTGLGVISSLKSQGPAPVDRRGGSRQPTARSPPMRSASCTPRSGPSRRLVLVNTYEDQVPGEQEVNSTLSGRGSAATLQQRCWPTGTTRSRTKTSPASGRTAIHPAAGGRHRLREDAEDGPGEGRQPFLG